MKKKENPDYLEELLLELKIRFDNDPKYYTKRDYRVLIEILEQLIKKEGGLSPDDLKTINGESIVGEGDIKTITCDYSFQLEGKYIYIEGDYDETEESIIPKNATFVEQENTIIL